MFRAKGSPGFNRYFAVEAGYARLGKPAYRYTRKDLPGRAYIIQASVFLVGITSAHLTEKFHAFVKLGFTYSRARLRGNSNDADFNAARGFPTSLGLTYRFD